MMITALDESSEWRGRHPAISEYRTFSESRVKVYRDNQQISTTDNGVRCCYSAFFLTYLLIYL